MTYVGQLYAYAYTAYEDQTKVSKGKKKKEPVIYCPCRKYVHTHIVPIFGLTVSYRLIPLYPERSFGPDGILKSVWPWQNQG